MTQINHLGQHTDGALIAQSQAQKEVTANALFNLLAGATQAVLSVTVADLGGSPTEAEAQLTADQFFGNSGFVCGGSPTVSGTLRVYPSGQHLFWVRNSTGLDLTVVADNDGSPPGNSVTVPNGGTKLLHSDGTDVTEIAAGGGAISYDLSFFFSTITLGALLGGHVALRSFTIPASASHRAYASTPGGSGDDTMIFSIKKNGSEVGTVTFTPLTAVGAVSIASDVGITPGDRLTIHAPDAGSPVLQSDLVNISISLIGYV